MYVTFQTIITIGGVLGAIGSIVALFWKLFKWVNHQKEQDTQIALMEAKHQKELAEMEARHQKEMADMKADYTKQIQDLRDTHSKDSHAIQEEQSIIVYGLLSCLKGLQEKGCNGPVTEAINKIDKYINQKAHAH